MTAMHWPFMSGSPHASHDPLHTLSQHTPSAQNPEAHSLPALHGSPRSTFVDGPSPPSAPLLPPPPPAPLPPIDPASARSTAPSVAVLPPRPPPPSVPPSLGQVRVVGPMVSVSVMTASVWPAFTPMTFSFPCPMTQPPASIALPTIVTFPFTPGM
jgi:hypothetical protein